MFDDIKPALAARDQLPLAIGEDEETQAGGKPRKPWRWLLKHIFQVDMDSCQRCGGKMRWVEAATTPQATSRLLAEHGLGPRAPPEPQPPI